MERAIVWKLFKLRKNGSLGPLFINAKAVIPVGEWMQAEAHATKGFAYRPGWHACFRPVAPHLSENPKAGPRRVWAKCEAEDFRSYDRPESQGGAWVLANRLRVLEVFPNGLPQEV